MRGWRWLRVPGLGILLFVLGLAGMAFFAGDRFIFFPEPFPGGYWEGTRASPIPVEDVWVPAPEGARLHAWYCRPPKARATVLLLHGNAGNVTHRIEYILGFQKIPASVLVLDYRGYGKSEGTPNERGVYADAEAAYRWLVGEGVPEERIVLYGESLGAAVAVEIACRLPVAGLVLQAGFTSASDMARRAIPFLPLGWLMKSRFASVEKVGAIRAPKLFLHGNEDEVVPYDLGLRLFEAAAEPKRWVGFPGYRHNDWPGVREEDWRAEVSRFLEEILPEDR